MPPIRLDAVALVAQRLEIGKIVSTTNGLGGYMIYMTARPCRHPADLTQVVVTAQRTQPQLLPGVAVASAVRCATLLIPLPIFAPLLRG